ncbi:hypothetical protein DKP76_11525 [Falsochrobactrum shanghaiense]|uniref:Scaffolding protein n=1 Tax=Falsochrobactrum shanghaiense TaxID=2201899 RepID=A0A316J7W6_9HYPH|nr:hypothetical protein [Falsochrobactrum shanghaiense]PWL17401.1 hypothetical protein DKP76_11525 [Falsochrobactrum shanghaiense]
MTMTDNPEQTGTVSDTSPNEANDVTSFQEATDDVFGSIAEAAAHLEDEEDEQQSDEAAASTDEAHQSDDETSEDDQAEEPKYRLADGTEATLSEIEEWRKGNLRQSDYTRKTMELAETRKELEARQQSTNQQAQFFQQNIDFAIDVAKAHLPQAPDPALAYSDPITFMQQKADYEARTEQLQQLLSAKQQHLSETSQQRQQAHKDMALNEAKALMDAMPELKDPAKLQSFQADLSRSVQSYGIKPDEIGNVMDHRLFLMARDAMAYQKLMSQKPKALDKARNAPPVQVPGQRQSPTEAVARANRARMEKLSKTGSINDAMQIDFE